MPADHGTPNTGDERDREVEAVARELKHNDECGPGPVSESEYRADAEAIVDLLSRLRAARSADGAALCPECGQTGDGPFCHHWDAGMERKVPTVAARSPQGEDHEAGIEAVTRHLMSEQVEIIEGMSEPKRSEYMTALRAEVRVALKRAGFLSPSRDGTVAELRNEDGVYDLAGHWCLRGKLVRPCVQCVEHARALLNGCADGPSRDGTVAVEDVRAKTIAEVVAFLRTYIDEEDALAVEAEFGVPERTERIHDQATKEEQQ